MTSSATAFSISIEPSKVGFSCTSNETILAAGIRQGVGLPYGCKDGACGSCKSKMTSGTVTHANFQRKALSEEEEANQFVLTCCATPHSDIVLESRQVTQLGALPIKKMPTRVSSLVKKSPDVVLMHLQLPANDTFAFRAGQYIEFILRDGSRRSYSMANAPHNGPSVELHIRHMPGGRFTDLVFGSMKEKDILRMEGPFGSFYLREDSDKPMVFLASGTGFAPLKALLEHMQHTGIVRPTTLYWGGRRPSDLYLQDWITAQLALMPNLTFIPVVSDALPEDQWAGRTGFVHQAVLDDFADLSSHEVYACGAPIVVDSARKTFCEKAHLPEEAFFADSFTSEADKKQA